MLNTADERRQRDRAAGVAGAAAARNHGEAELDAGAHQARHLVLGIGRDHDERILDAPVGGVGDVRDAREGVEADAVGARVLRQQPARLVAQLAGALERSSKARTARRPASSSWPDLGVARRRRPARGGARSRAGDAPAPRSAGGGASGSRAGRPRGRGCAARPRCRPAPRRASAPSGRCGARRAARRAGSRRPARAGGSRSRGRRTRCSCRGSRGCGWRGRPAAPAGCGSPKGSWACGIAFIAGIAGVAGAGPGDRSWTGAAGWRSQPRGAGRQAGCPVAQSHVQVERKPILR